MAAGGFFNSLEAVLGGLSNVDALVSHLQAEDSTPESILLNSVMFPRSPSLVTSDYIVSIEDSLKGACSLIKPDQAKAFIVESDENMGDGEKVMAIKVETPRASYSSFNANKVSMFVNALPPLIANSLVPYVEVEFEMPTKEGNGTFKPFGLTRFLLGDAPPTGFDIGNQAAKMTSMPDGPNGAYSAYAGMEMFTAPATLRTAPESRDALLKPVIDPNAPIAAINSFEVSVASSGQGQGFNLAKKATMAMTIFDRSRFRDFGELFQIKQYGGATVWVTYGWRCKQQAAGDPFAEFINSCMLVKEPFTITQPGFNFDRNVVKVSMTLGSKTFNELNDMTLADVYRGGAGNSYGLSSGFRELKTSSRTGGTWGALIDKINALAREVEPGVKGVDVLGSGLIPAPDTESPLPPEFDKGIEERINALIASLKEKQVNKPKPGAKANPQKPSDDTAKKIEELSKALKQYWGGNPSTGHYVQYDVAKSASTAAASQLVNDICHVSNDPFNSKWAALASKW